MPDPGLRFLVMGVAFALTACGNSGESEPPRDKPQQAAATDAEITGARLPATTPSAADATVPSARPKPSGEGIAGTQDTRTDTPEASSPAGNLTAYIGKFPFDEVNGVTWKTNPTVQAGIRATVTDTSVRNAILNTEGGPSAPIKMYQGKVGSWSCQPHNCGEHQWAVLVDPKSGATDVCYYNAAETGDASRWFLANGQEESRSGNCSVV